MAIKIYVRINHQVVEINENLIEVTGCLSLRGNLSLSARTDAQKGLAVDWRL